MTDYLDTDETSSGDLIGEIPRREANVNEMRFPPNDPGGVVVAWCVMACVFGMGFLAGALLL